LERQNNTTKTSLIVSSFPAGIRKVHVPKIRDVAVQQWYELHLHFKGLQIEPHWALHTYCGKSENVEVQNVFKGEITLHVA
jgi:hypothetical protein